MNQSFTKFYLYSGLIAFIIILYLITQSAFKNGKPTCNNYVFNVYLYLATHPDINSVDEHIWSLAKKKQKIIDIFETAIKEMAIDCNLFYERNVYKNETKLNCFNLEDKDKKIII